ncbi:universal stress protein [Dactylosporangium sp. CS-047395]|uniref:universal stress protein n=1 Tax=Dactylosporangium sp. CS-047395 TaxID=3239936 RepID=UPI003D94D58E
MPTSEVATPALSGAVVVGVDGSAGGERAIRWAAADAARRGRPMHLLHVCEGPALVHPPPGLWLPVPAEPGVAGHAARLLESAAGLVRQAAAGVHVTTQAVGGRPIPTLLATSERAGSIVLGRRTGGEFNTLLGGSTVAALAALAACPVVVVRERSGGSGPNAGRVVVGVDGTAASEPALAYAYEQAAARGAGLTAIHAYQLPVDPALGGRLPGSFELGARHDAARRVLDEATSGWHRRHPDVDLRLHAELGGAAGALTRAGLDAQLLVVAAHGHGALGRLLLGSVSRAMVHHAPCPVAVVRADRANGPANGPATGPGAAPVVPRGPVRARGR